MKKRRLIPGAVASIILLVLVFGIHFSFSQGSGGTFAGSAGRYAPGEILVKYKKQAESSAVRMLQSKMKAETIRKFSGIGVAHVKIPSDQDVESAVSALRKDPSVLYAEPNYAYSTSSTIPNDSFFPNLWGLLNTGQTVNGTAGLLGADISATGAWGISTGENPVKVAVIDTGVDVNHPDLTANITAERYDFVDDDSNPADSHEHGTHVAGTIAAAGNNAAGVTGVSWTARIMPLRAGSALGLLYTSDIIAAIDYARANGAKVINASFGGASYSQALSDAISAAGSAGILFVAAAGNDGQDNDLIPHYPSGYNLDNIISVAATDQNDQLCSWSNYGSGSVHVAAPGLNIYSTRPGRKTLWSDNFDDGDIAGWTTGGTNNTWGVTNTQHSSGSWSLAVAPGGSYQNSSDAWARMPVRDLSSESGTKLTFRLRGNSQAGMDRLYVQTSTDNVNWTSRPVLVGESVYGSGISGDLSTHWYDAAVDLGSQDGQNTVFVRFRFASDASTVYSGWYVDDILVTAASDVYTGAEYQFKSGTSMATPHVAGLAALIWGHKPYLTASQVRQVILNCVDIRGSLAGKTSTGGRINALNALLIPDQPDSLTASTNPNGTITLSWADNSVDESGFIIERKTGAGAYARIGTAGTNIRTYTDAAELAAATYVYQVAAYNAGGNSSYSNEASATTSGYTPSTESGGGGGGGCFIATAAFGSPLEPSVLILREFRDRFLLKSGPGLRLVHFYYRVSPPLADRIEKSAGLRLAVRICLVPAVALSWVLISLGPALVLSMGAGLVLLGFCLVRLKGRLVRR